MQGHPSVLQDPIGLCDEFGVVLYMLEDLITQQEVERFVVVGDAVGKGVGDSKDLLAGSSKTLVDVLR